MLGHANIQTTRVSTTDPAGGLSGVQGELLIYSVHGHSMIGEATYLGAAAFAKHLAFSKKLPREAQFRTEGC